jgi:hypothetical protein
MNRILFLPFNRNLSYFMARASLKGHSVYWKRWGIEAQKGEYSNLHTNDFFKEGVKEDIRRSSWAYARWKLYWVDYFRKKDINHIVTDMDGHIAVLAALDVASDTVKITTSYMSHGPGEIYYCPRRLDWYSGGIFDYFYAQTVYAANYVKHANSLTKARRFTRKQVKKRPEKTVFKGKKIILYAPCFMLHGGSYHGLSTNEQRVKNNFTVLDSLIRSPCNLLWCHRPERDRFPNPLIERLANVERLHSNVKWIKKNSCTQFKKADLVLTDIGASVFFEAIHAGKPTVCLQWKPAGAPMQFRQSTKAHLINSIKRYSDGELVSILNELVITPHLHKYIPWKYLEVEINTPNDKLVWEEK